MNITDLPEDVLFEIILLLPYNAITHFHSANRKLFTFCQTSRIVSIIIDIFINSVSRRRSITAALRKAFKLNMTSMIFKIFNTKFPLLHDYDLSSYFSSSIKHGNLEMVKFLLTKATMNEYLVNSCLSSSIEHGNLEMVKFLLTKATMNENLSYSLTYQAAINSQWNILFYLLTQKVPVISQETLEIIVMKHQHTIIDYISINYPKEYGVSRECQERVPEKIKDLHLQTINILELKSIAKHLHIPLYYKYRKVELINAIQKEIISY